MIAEKPFRTSLDTSEFVIWLEAAGVYVNNDLMGYFSAYKIILLVVVPVFLWPLLGTITMHCQITHAFRSPCASPLRCFRTLDDTFTTSTMATIQTFFV